MTESSCSNLRTKLKVFLNTFSSGMYFFTKLNLLKPTGHVMHQQFNIQQL